MVVYFFFAAFGVPCFPYQSFVVVVVVVVVGVHDKRFRFELLPYTEVNVPDTTHLEGSFVRSLSRAFCINLQFQSRRMNINKKNKTAQPLCLTSTDMETGFPHRFIFPTEQM